MPIYEKTSVVTGTFAYQLPTGTVIFGNDIFPFVHGITGAVAPQMQQGSYVLLQGYMANFFQPSGTAGAGVSEWNDFPGTVAWRGSDNPTYNVDATGGVTGTIAVGAKVKLTHYTEKFFIVTSIGTPSGTVTPMTLYGGTDWDLAASGTITSPQYSHMRTPFGFPVSPLKWTETLSDTALQTQATPAQNTWYNLGSLLLSMPIGVWRVNWKVFLQGADASAVNVGLQGTISTANNSESDAGNTIYAVVTIPAGGSQGMPVTLSRIIAAASKTAYYCNARTISSGLDNLYFANNGMGMILTFESAYL